VLSTHQDCQAIRECAARAATASTTHGGQTRVLFVCEMYTTHGGQTWVCLFETRTRHIEGLFVKCTRHMEGSQHMYGRHAFVCRATAFECTKSNSQGLQEVSCLMDLQSRQRRRSSDPPVSRKKRLACHIGTNKIRRCHARQYVLLGRDHRCQ
jgi:hypothetical protein